MKSKSSNYLIARHPVFNTEAVPVFDAFDKEHSIILWKTLFLNAFEVLGSYSSAPFIMVLDESDRDHIPGVLTQKKDKIIFGDLHEKETLLKNLNDKYFKDYENNIVFMSESIGYTHNDISKVHNILNVNDDCIVLARSASNKICFAGFNLYPEFLESSNPDYEYFLAQSCRYNSVLYTLDNYIYLDSIQDFRILYQELSKKESLAYCSQEMHEQFTHLFIEYKELLK